MMHWEALCVGGKKDPALSLGIAAFRCVFSQRLYSLQRFLDNPSKRIYWRGLNCESCILWMQMHTIFEAF